MRLESIIFTDKVSLKGLSNQEIKQELDNLDISNLSDEDQSTFQKIKALLFSVIDFHAQNVHMVEVLANHMNIDLYEDVSTGKRKHSYDVLIKKLKMSIDTFTEEELQAFNQELLNIEDTLLQTCKNIRGAVSVNQLDFLYGLLERGLMDNEDEIKFKKEMVLLWKTSGVLDQFSISQQVKRAKMIASGHLKDVNPSDLEGIAALIFRSKRQCSYEELKNIIKNHVKAGLLLGKDRSEIEQELFLLYQLPEDLQERLKSNMDVSQRRVDQTGMVIGGSIDLEDIENRTADKYKLTYDNFLEYWSEAISDVASTFKANELGPVTVFSEHNKTLLDQYTKDPIYRARLRHSDLDGEAIFERQILLKRAITQLKNIALKNGFSVEWIPQIESLQVENNEIVVTFTLEVPGEADEVSYVRMPLEGNEYLLELRDRLNSLGNKKTTGSQEPEMSPFSTMNTAFAIQALMNLYKQKQMFGEAHISASVLANMIVNMLIVGYGAGFDAYQTTSKVTQLFMESSSVTPETVFSSTVQGVGSSVFNVLLMLAAVSLNIYDLVELKGGYGTDVEVIQLVGNLINLAMSGTELGFSAAGMAGIVAAGSIAEVLATPASLVVAVIISITSLVEAYAPLKKEAKEVCRFFGETHDTYYQGGFTYDKKKDMLSPVGMGIIKKIDLRKGEVTFGSHKLYPSHTSGCDDTRTSHVITGSMPHVITKGKDLKLLNIRDIWGYQEKVALAVKQDKANKNKKTEEYIKRAKIVVLPVYPETTPISYRWNHTPDIASISSYHGYKEAMYLQEHAYPHFDFSFYNFPTTHTITELMYHYTPLEVDVVLNKGNQFIMESNLPDEFAGKIKYRLYGAGATHHLILAKNNQLTTCSEIGKKNIWVIDSRNLKSQKLPKIKGHCLYFDSGVSVCVQDSDTATILVTNEMGDLYETNVQLGYFTLLSINGETIEKKHPKDKKLPKIEVNPRKDLLSILADLGDQNHLNRVTEVANYHPEHVKKEFDQLGKTTTAYYLRESKKIIAKPFQKANNYRFLKLIQPQKVDDEDFKMLYYDVENRRILSKGSDAKHDVVYQVPETIVPTEVYEAELIGDHLMCILSEVHSNHQDKKQYVLMWQDDQFVLHQINGDAALYNALNPTTDDALLRIGAYFKEPIALAKRIQVSLPKKVSRYIQAFDGQVFAPDIEQPNIEKLIPFNHDAMNSGVFAQAAKAELTFISDDWNESYETQLKGQPIDAISDYLRSRDHGKVQSKTELKLATSQTQASKASKAHEFYHVTGRVYMPAGKQKLSVEYLGVISLKIGDQLIIKTGQQQRSLEKDKKTVAINIPTPGLYFIEMSIDVQGSPVFFDVQLNGKTIQTQPSQNLIGKTGTSSKLSTSDSSSYYLYPAQKELFYQFGGFSKLEKIQFGEHTGVNRVSESDVGVHALTDKGLEWHVVGRKKNLVGIHEKWIQSHPKWWEGFDRSELDTADKPKEKEPLSASDHKNDIKSMIESKYIAINGLQDEFLTGKVYQFDEFLMPKSMDEAVIKIKNMQGVAYKIRHLDFTERNINIDIHKHKIYVGNHLYHYLGTSYGDVNGEVVDPKNNNLILRNVVHHITGNIKLCKGYHYMHSFNNGNVRIKLNYNTIFDKKKKDTACKNHRTQFYADYDGVYALDILFYNGDEHSPCMRLDIDHETLNHKAFVGPLLGWYDTDYKHFIFHRPYGESASVKPLAQNDKTAWVYNDSDKKLYANEINQKHELENMFTAHESIHATKEKQYTGNLSINGGKKLALQKALFGKKHAHIVSHDIQHTLFLIDDQKTEKKNRVGQPMPIDSTKSYFVELNHVNNTLYITKVYQSFLQTMNKESRYEVDGIGLSSVVAILKDITTADKVNLKQLNKKEYSEVVGFYVYELDRIFLLEDIEKLIELTEVFDISFLDDGNDDRGFYVNIRTKSCDVLCYLNKQTQKINVVGRFAQIQKISQTAEGSVVLLQDMKENSDLNQVKLKADMLLVSINPKVDQVNLHGSFISNYNKVMLQADAREDLPNMFSDNKKTASQKVQDLTVILDSLILPQNIQVYKNDSGVMFSDRFMRWKLEINGNSWSRRHICFQMGKETISLQSIKDHLAKSSKYSNRLVFLSDCMKKKVNDYLLKKAS